MLYQWIGERPLHLAILKSFNLEDNFNTSAFPVFSVEEMPSNKIAEYIFPRHVVKFNETYLQNNFGSFAHVYFHELAHSTNIYTNRWNRIWANSSPVNVKNIVGLEERIADIVAFILCDVFSAKFNFKGSDRFRYNSIKNVFINNETNYALPWQEVEEAALCLLKDKTCPKVNNALQYYKNYIVENDFTMVTEGKFDGQVIRNKNVSVIKFDDENVRRSVTSSR